MPPRETGHHRITTHSGETVRAFIPNPLPPTEPPLQMDLRLASLHAEAAEAVARLDAAATMIPSADWFLYGFVRKEAVITSQIEGTEATLRDIFTWEATRSADRPDDVREVCNYIDALTHARSEIARPGGLPLSTRLLCEAHTRLMQGVRGQDKLPGQIRRSQNWIGGSRPGNARFVPPPPELVPHALADLEHWIHAPDALPPLVRAGLAHVQFETIHPFLDGNGRIGRLLIALLLEHWRILRSPMLYISVAFKRRQREYYDRLSAVRTDGDWEGWTAFFLEAVAEAARDALSAAQQLHRRLADDRAELLRQPNVTVYAVRLFDLLPTHPLLTLALTQELLQTSRPTASSAIAILTSAGILRETTGRKRDRVHAYHAYLDVLTRDA